ncbi:MAG: hypothetical protein ACOX5R_00015 [bacterium]
MTLALMSLATCAQYYITLWHEVWRMREHRRESLLNRFCLILILRVWWFGGCVWVISSP